MFLSRKWKPYAKKHSLSSITGSSAESVITVPWHGMIPEMLQSIICTEMSKFSLNLYPTLASLTHLQQLRLRWIL